MPDPFLFCFGFGYSARELARSLDGGWRVGGTTRGEDDGDSRPPGLPAGGLHVFSREHPLAADTFKEATHIVVSIPPDAQGDPVADLLGDQIAALKNLVWLGYLSTTGGYGDRHGDWVDESSALAPTGERGRRRVTAERSWLDLWRDKGVPVHIFRLAGIYGPGRNALETVRAGRARRIVKEGQVFSRIHVADIAATLVASMARPRPGAIYNVCDDDPAPPQDVIAYACELLGVTPPPEEPFDGATLSQMSQSFYRDNKRVRNDLIKNELGVVLAYPDYRSGLEALLKNSA